VTGGDFVTAPEISPLFAQALATQVGRTLRAGSGAHPGIRRPVPAAWRVICWSRCRERGAPCERYSIVEVSQISRNGSESCWAGEDVEWLTAAPSGFAGVMLANEVLDVMPVRLFVSAASA